MTWTIDARVEPDGPVEAGATFWVWVRAESTERAECRAIHCEVGWATSGRGTPDRGGAFAGQAAGGAASPGTPLTAEFAVAVPGGGPITYDGALIDIRWSVRVWIDLPWTQDPEVTVPLTVVPRRG